MDLPTAMAYACLILGAIIMFAPVLWIVLSSFKGLSEIYRFPPTFFPEKWITTNYAEALQKFPFLRYLVNSVTVTVVATLLTLTINSMAAFALSKYVFRGREAIFLIILGTLMIPLQVIMPPSATPTGVFLLRQYMLTIPDELLEAARMDGAGEFRVYWQVVLPLTVPALTVLTVFSIMWRWNDFLWPLIVINQDRLFTLQLGLARFRGELVTDWNYVLAMTVLSILPITVVFGFLQRYLVSGIATTGLKG